jgi:adenylate cyclase
MPASWLDSPHDVHRRTNVIMVADVVESVRLMEQDEHEFIQRWQRFVRRALDEVLPDHRGRMHKSLGDGLMLEFDSAQQGVQAALALQGLCREANAGVPPERQMHLRIGSHVAQFVADEHDIYGTDVNLSARIATLAGPGEVVVTATLRDQLTAGLDADIEDLGECHLKHVREPVRVFRVGPVGQSPVISVPEPDAPDFRPTIAVIPFDARSNEAEHFVIGELIAEGVIAQLARSPDLRVISRLSTTALRGRASAMADVESRLGASFVLSGSYVASGSRILVMAELADTRNDSIVWSERMSGDVADLLESQSELLQRIASATSRALIDSEVKRSLSLPMPRLDSSSLLLGGISMMHRSSVLEFERSRQALDALIDRHGRLATPRAWLAKWHVLKIIRGLSASPEKDCVLALEQTKRALDLEPGNALTLAVEGHAYCQLRADHAMAELRLRQAIESNPNEPMAWLFRSVVSTMWGSPEDAVTEVEYANALSPIDPLRYYFDMLFAAALLTVHQQERAIAFARQSLRANRHHEPTLRVLLTAQFEAGHHEEARMTLAALLRESPGLTVSGYLAIGSGASVTRQRCASALRGLGVPEQ